MIDSQAVNYGQKYWNCPTQATRFVVTLMALLATAPSLFSQAVVDPSTETVATATPSTSGPISATFDTYRIGVGDILHINVWKEPDHSVDSLVVRPDGKISLPLVRELNAVGLTPVELEDLLTEKFKEFINTPTVTVVVREIRSQMVHMTGAVNRPGSLLIQPGMTVWQAISEAGGIREYGRRKKMYLVREIGGKKTTMDYDYNAVMQGEVDKDILLLPGDTIVVPE